MTITLKELMKMTPKEQLAACDKMTLEERAKLRNSLDAFEKIEVGRAYIRSMVEGIINNTSDIEGL